ncbi:hypothetical protein [Parasphingorhabdus sp.]|uniref:hypothetical protein n=1 Tax=Parasphingorhabdus sp. TaxID=2709688 RepID=UPI003266E09F
MFAILLASAALASALPANSTAGLLRVDNIDCISNQIPVEKAKALYDIVRQGMESEAFNEIDEIATGCQKRHAWTEFQTKNAFRIAILNGWIAETVKQIKQHGDYRPLLDVYFDKHAGGGDRHILDRRLAEGKLNVDLAKLGYPESSQMMELAFAYWEWRYTLMDVEEDFLAGRLRK